MSIDTSASHSAEPVGRALVLIEEIAELAQRLTNETLGQLRLSEGVFNAASDARDCIDLATRRALRQMSDYQVGDRLVLQTPMGGQLVSGSIVRLYANAGVEHAVVQIGAQQETYRVAQLDRIATISARAAEATTGE